MSQIEETRLNLGFTPETKRIDLRCRFGTPKMFRGFYLNLETLFREKYFD